MQLRPYQTSSLTLIEQAWKAGHRNVCLVSPTGSGKTVIFSEAAKREPGLTCAIAHRQELVGQMSMALAKDEVWHRIIGPDNVIKNIIRLQIEEFGRDFYNPNARCAVAGVDTIVSRVKEGSASRQALLQWGQQVSLWVQDECHHLLTDNKWGKAISIFPNARGLGVTATPERTDGKGIGRDADGLFDHMILGPSMRDLIDMRYLTDYRIFCPPSDLDLSSVGTGTDGDYVRKQLAAKTKDSSIMGDVIAHYLQIASGKLGVTFAPDVETATSFAAGFNAAGIPAEVVSAKTPDAIRHAILKRFKRREILQLVNVDLFGEGFDLPAIEVVSMARATQSYGLYVQQFGRACRIMDNKVKAIIIDHVGNVVRHGLPDSLHIWSLDRRERRSGSNQPDDVIPLRTCLSCMSPYERVLVACPICGAVPQPSQRSAPEFVDGDLYELDPAVLASMRGEIEKIDEHPDAILSRMKRAGKDYVVAKGIANRHAERQESQVNLRNAIAQWAGYHTAFGRSDREQQRRFYHQFGVDVLSACALNRADADKLRNQVEIATIKLDLEWRKKWANGCAA